MRWYNPVSGTLLGRDPFAGYPNQPYSLHPYAYGYSNPVSNTDPSGRCVVAEDPGCVEEHLKNEFNVIIDYRDVAYPGDTNQNDLASKKRLWWFNSTDLRKELLTTLQFMNAQLNNHVRLVFFSGTPIIFFRSIRTGSLGQWVPLIKTIFLYQPSLDLYGIDGFNWTITHETAHTLDTNNYARELRRRVNNPIESCSDFLDGPTWYNRSQPTNVYYAGEIEDWAESVAVYVWSKGAFDPFAIITNAFFLDRRAIGSQSTRPNVGDGRPGWPMRRYFIQGIFR